MNSSVEKLNCSTLLIQSQTRKNSGTASSTMRKYQQLALTIVSVVSLIAFLFYKHEYDRLRYTLEYLEMFGNVPTDVGSSVLCGSTMLKKLNTAPHTWIKLKNDIAIYSVFWDEGNGVVNPLLRALAAVKKSVEPKTELSARILFEKGEITIDTLCSIEEIHLKNYGNELVVEDDLIIAHIVCRSEKFTREIPYLTQFKIDNNEWSMPLFVQESESWKSVSNSSCLCLYSNQFPFSNLRLIEFISYYGILGVEKFVFYGSLLTPLARKLLDKYGDETNIFFEEKSFLIPEGFLLDDSKQRALIKSDCLYRHRDNYENVLVLKLNEYLIPRNKNSLQEILTSVGGKSVATEFHFASQRVCQDEKHEKSSDLLLNSQIRLLDSNNENKIAILRPHLIDTALNSRASGNSGFLHIPSSLANIYTFEICSDENHPDTDHLPSSARFVDSIKKSLLYRKWKINS